MEITSCLMKLSRRGIFQHDKGPKHSVEITQAFLKKNKVKTMVWSSMSPDFNPTEHL